MTRARTAPVEAPGFAARRVAAEIIEGVLVSRRSLDEQIDGEHANLSLAVLSDRDRALARMLAATVLRRLGSLRQLLGAYLSQGFPKDAPRAEVALMIGAAQILWLDVPDHAAVDLSVRLAQADRRGSRYVGLVNAVLRRVTRDGVADLANLPAGVDTPDWLFARWKAYYGEETASAIAEALKQPPALDVTVKSDPEEWAARLHGVALAAGTVRTLAPGMIARLPGFDEGAWWVQDAAAAFPARLLGDVRGQRIADLCAAPGGKTAQLAHAGAAVTAVDRAKKRLTRLRANLDRLGLAAETVEADASEWQAEPFDGVLLDAPCSSTGTIRRHPDIAWLKRENDVTALAASQRRLLDRAVELVKPGGLLIYCTCSLEPEEGEAQIDALLARDARVARVPVSAAELGGLGEAITPQGDMRTLPSHLAGPDGRLAGLDGFYAARLRRM